MVMKDWEEGAGEGTCAEVDESNMSFKLGVARVQAMAFWKHHPISRVEAWVSDAMTCWTDTARSPVLTHRAEGSVIHEIT
jgi:hypothetical protein